MGERGRRRERGEGGGGGMEADERGKEEGGKRGERKESVLTSLVP